jgi:hypothetical protein
MTQKEFIEVLKEKDYSYEIEGDNIVVTHKWTVYLSDLTSLPSGVVFRNEGYVNERGDVYLNALTSLPPDVVFSNKGNVNLRDLTSLPPGVVFSNKGNVNLRDLTSLPSGVEFRNEGNVNLNSIIGGWFFEWKGNVEGIDSKRLLNSMISKGIFER